MTLAFLDANVLVPSYTRTLLIMSAPTAGYGVAWSAYVEAEAMRHQPRRAKPISQLRRAFGWNALVPDQDVELADTEDKDKPVLSAASLAGAEFVVTENVRDFGVADLMRLQMSAVHPDLFMAHRLTVSGYKEVLTELSLARIQAPSDPEEIHRVETGGRLPLLAARMKSAYSVEVDPPAKGKPRLAFRGVRCVSCSEILTDPTGLEFGLGPECRD